MNAVVENREYQDEAVENSILALGTADRAQIHMACGTGKSYVQAKTLKAFLERREALEDDPPVIHVFVPNLGLVRQMERSFRTILGEEVEYLGVGTKKETKKEAEERGFIMPMTTSEQKIRETVADRTKPLVVFSTYQSSKTLAEGMIAEDGEVLGAALSFMDEAHRTAGEKSRTSPFAYPLHDDNLKSDKRLFYTATPNVTEFSVEGDKELHSMNNKELYGEPVFDYPYSRALKDGVVSPFRIQVPIISKQEVEAYRELKELYEADENSIIAELALMKVIEETGQNKILTFHNKVDDSKVFASRLSKTIGQDQFRVKHIDGTHSAGERALAFEQMEEGPMVITSVRALGEGADCPGIQGILFADPRSSTREIIQNIGRLQRKDENNPNKNGSIICPIVIDADSKETPEEQILNSNYKTIFRVTEALRASSDVAAVQTKEASREFGRTGRLPHQEDSSIEFLGSAGLPPEKMDQLLGAMRLATFLEMADHFQVNMGELYTYVDEKGRMPQPDDVDSKDIGLWFAGVQLEAERGVLDKEQMAQVKEFQELEVELARSSNEQNLHRLAKLDGKIDSLDEVDRTQFPHIDTWIEKVREEHASGTLPLADIERCEELSFFSWCDENTDVHTAALHRDRFMDRHGMPPTADGTRGGNAEASIVLPFELEAARRADQEAVLQAEAQENILKTTNLHLNQIRGTITPEQEEIINAQDSLRFPEGMSREDATFQALEAFWDEHNAPPTREGDIAGRTERLLAEELEEVEGAYVEAYLHERSSYSENEEPFARLLPSQRQIALSKAFMQDIHEGENLVRGTFQQLEGKKGWAFKAEPLENQDGTSVFNTGWEAPAATYKMNLTPEQKVQVKALGDEHFVRIDLKRAGKHPEPHKDGALGGIKTGWVKRDDEGFFKFMVARFNDRAATGRPTVNQTNLDQGKIKPGDMITNLTPNDLREGKSYLLVSNQAFIGQTQKLRDLSFSGEFRAPQISKLSQCPGFSWYEHNDEARDFDKTVAMISKPNGGINILRNAKARQGDNGIANTLRELDKTVMTYRKAENAPPAVQKVMTQYKDEYRAITVAARALEDRKAEEAAKQKTALLSPPGKSHLNKRKHEDQVQ